MAYTYDNQNIFAKILRGEIPNNTVYEDDFALAFHDVQPQAPDEASDAEITGFTRAIGKVCTLLGVAPGAGGNGYRLLANAGRDGVQEVMHLHVHIAAGRPLGRMLQRAE